MKLLLVSPRSDLYDRISELNPALEIVQCTDISKDINLPEFDLIAMLDYVEGITQEIVDSKYVINLHQSLLPAFPQNTALIDAYTQGVKVTGVTVHKVSKIENKILSGKIIAQYPVLIDNYTHYDELETEINKLESELYPLVIKSVLEDKVFDIVDLLVDSQVKKSCCGCNGNCNKQN